MQRSLKMSRWLLEKSKEDPANPFWAEAFQACNSEDEFQRYLDQAPEAPEVRTLKTQWDQIPRSRQEKKSPEQLAEIKNQIRKALE